MRKLLMLFIGLLFFVPLSALAVEKGSDKAPPVEQSLVREGDFALRLADTLGLAKTDSEADAERVLAEARIAPKNGWISDFPVTPDVLDEIKASVADAADAGRIKMDKKTAEDKFYALGKDLELPIVADTTEKQKGYVTGEAYGEATDYQDEAVITNYYYDEGPPVITYYPPPPDYAYLYAWDPYPFWWGGYWFPGYYVLNNFTIIVDGGHHGGHHHHHHRDGWHDRGGGTRDRGDVAAEWTRGDTKLISNRVVDKNTSRVSTIDPVTRNTRTAAGFTRSGGSSNSTRFTNPDTRRGAENILKNSVTRDKVTSMTASGWAGRNNAGISSNAGKRSFDPAPSLRGRTYDSSRSYNSGRSFNTVPSVMGRSNDAGRSFDPAPSLRGASRDFGRSAAGGSRQFAPVGRSMPSGSGFGSSGYSAPRSFSPAPSAGSGGFRSPGSGGSGFGRGGGFGGGGHGGSHGGCFGGKC